MLGHAMELYQLRTFVAVAREGNLTRAAERLFSSQSAVSGQIKALEEELGLKLFERTPSGMVPTSAGDVLWEQAENVLNASKDLSLRAAALKGNVAGNLRLGLNSGGGSLRGAELLALLSQRHPGLRFEISSGTSGAVMEGVSNRDLDAGFFEGSCEDAMLESVLIKQLALVIVIPPGWEAELADSGWSTLQKKPWAFGSQRCSYYKFFAGFCKQHKIEITPHFQIDGESTSLDLVAAGSALTLTTRQRLKISPEIAGRVAIWPHFEEMLPLSLCYLKGRASDPLLRAVRAAAQTVWSREETVQTMSD